MRCYRGCPAAAAARGTSCFQMWFRRWWWLWILPSPTRQLGAKGRIKDWVALPHRGPSIAVLHPLCRRGGIWPAGCCSDELSEYDVRNKVTWVLLSRGFIEVWRLLLSISFPIRKGSWTVEAFGDLFHNLLCSLCWTGPKKALMTLKFKVRYPKDTLFLHIFYC